MNAVIVELRKKQAAALDESGRIVRIHNAGYEIGQTIELHEVKPIRTAPALKRLGTGVAAAVLVAMIGTGTAYAMPYGTVTLDGDSSVEYTINCFDYVLDVKGSNAEGEALLAEIDTRQLRHHRIDAAVAATVEHMEPPETELHISAETRADRHSERLREELEPLIEQEQTVPSSKEIAPQAEASMPDTEKFFTGYEQEHEQESRGSMQPNAPSKPFAEEDEGHEPPAEAEEWLQGEAPDPAHEESAQAPARTPADENIQAPTEAPLEQERPQE